MSLIKVPAGTFLMGSADGERGNILGNEAQHQVTLTHDYYLGKVEVTISQWEAVMGSPMPTECDEIVSSHNRPVSCVSWDNIAGPGGFMDKLNQQLGTTGFRLPTEAEWERAARAGTTTRYAHGDVLECDDECESCDGHYPHMWYCGFLGFTCLEIDPNDVNNCLRFAPRGARQAFWTQPNPFGFHNMHGNVWEWVQDRYGDYTTGSTVDPTGPTVGTDRIIRGGDWASEARLNRSASRVRENPGNSGVTGNPGNPDGIDGYGFRIAISSVENLGIQINAGLNDAWYNPATNGQGFLITVFPEIKQMFLAWFTYDTERPPEDVSAMLGEPGHRWLTAQGPYIGDTANLTIFATKGGVFDSAEPTTTTDPAGDGSLILEFSDCENGMVNYEITSLGITGEIPIQRIALDNIALCESLGAQQINQ
jgi:formylglycine-generating enzyme required for sulfatase activity